MIASLANSTLGSDPYTGRANTGVIGVEGAFNGWGFSDGEGDGDGDGDCINAGIGARGMGIAGLGTSTLRAAAAGRWT